VSNAGRTRASVSREIGARLIEKLGYSILVPWLKTHAAGSRGPHPAAGANRTRLGMCGVLNSLDAPLDRLKSGSEHGGGQVGYALAIADSGFDPFRDQPLL
jgi:hypothetical protein